MSIANYKEIGKFSRTVVVGNSEMYNVGMVTQSTTLRSSDKLRSFVLVFTLAFFVLFFQLCAPFVSAAATTASNDTDHPVFNSKARILQPRYWVIQERTRDAAYDVTIDSVTLHDQADSGSRATKFVFFFHSTRPGIFDLPNEVTKKVTDAQLVNFYMFQNLKSSIGAKLIKAEAVTINGSEGYLLTWRHLSPRGVVFEVLDLFSFKGDEVFHTHGEYAVNLGVGPKEKVDAIVRSTTLQK